MVSEPWWHNNPRDPAPEFEVGEIVYYHPVIGREHTGVKYKIRAVGDLHGESVAWLEGKSGCVAQRALSPASGMSIFEIQGGRITHGYLMRKSKSELACIALDYLNELERLRAELGRAENRIGYLTQQVIDLKVESRLSSDVSE